MGLIDEQAGRRLAALGDYAILDTQAEAEFDELAYIASRICQTPVALVSLVETYRQWFKARIGVDLAETPIDQSVCALGLASTDLLIIPDLTADSRTCLNTLVTEAPAIRFYAGAPLVTPLGVVIGMLCVIDVEPRPAGLSDVQQRMLKALANQVIAQLELRKVARLAQVETERHVKAEEAGQVGMFEVDVVNDTLIVSPELCRIFGLPVQASYTPALLEALVLPDDRLIHSDQASRATGSAPQVVEYRICRPSDREVRWISRRAEFIRDDDGKVLRMVGLCQDVTEQRMLNAEISHRLKNTLSLVQSIATQTLRRVTERGPVEEFEQRLIALGTAHDVLLQRTGTSAPVRAVIDAVVDALSAKPRTSTDGPHIELGSQTTLILAMLVHELTTNSIKYGALSTPGGSNLVRWAITDDGLTFTLDWIERGGPPAIRPNKTGFGSRLISRGLGSSSRVSTEFDETGFSASLRVPLADLA